MGYRPLTVVQILLEAERISNNPEEHERESQPQIKATRERWKAIPGEQRCLLRALRLFLTVILIILFTAIVGFVIVDEVVSWAGTPWLMGIASGLLAVASGIVVLLAARREA